MSFSAESVLMSGQLQAVLAGLQAIWLLLLGWLHLRIAKLDDVRREGDAELHQRIDHVKDDYARRDDVKTLGDRLSGEHQTLTKKVDGIKSTVDKIAVKMEDK